MIASNRLYLLLIVTAVLFAFSALFSIFTNFGLALNLILLFLVALDFFLTPSPANLTVERMVSPRLSIGRANLITLKATNNSKITLTCRLKDSPPSQFITNQNLFSFQLTPRQELSSSYQLTPNRRGRYSFGDLYLRYKSFLGLFWRQKRVPAETEVLVFCDLKALTDLSIKLATSTELGKLHQKQRGQGTDFSSLKEYIDGDNSKSIDWKATARRNHPIVRTYDIEEDQKLIILIDAGRMMLSELSGLTRFDHALNAALSLALTALSGKDRVGLGIFTNKPLLYLPPKRGKSYFPQLLSATATIEPQLTEPDYAQMLAYFATAPQSRSLFVLLTDLSDPSGASALLSGLAALQKRHLTLCVTLADKQIEEISRPQESNLPIDQSLIFQRAVAIDLLKQRQLAFNQIRQQGCLILDATPEKLSKELLDQYFKIKAKSLL